jgi:streptogramin lyase
VIKLRPTLPLAFAALSTLGASAQITEFAVPTAASRPYTIVAGPDGNMWFTESNGNKIASITPAGVITEYTVPSAASGPYGIAIGRTGDVWFTERFADKIGRFTPATQTFAEFRIPTPFAQPWEIALAADGNLWFTEDDAHQIGRVTPTGQVREFTPPSCCFPLGIAAGADGKMWFALEIGDQIGRIEPNGAMTMFQIPSVQVLPWDITAAVGGGGMWFTELAGRALGRIAFDGTIAEDPIAGAFSGIAGVCAGPDGNRWFTQNDTDLIGAMDASGTVRQLLNTSLGARPLSIAHGSDGNLWFTEADTNKIGRVNLAAPGRLHVLSLDAGFTPNVQTAHLGERVQWTFLGPNPHSLVDDTGLGLFDSGMQRFVSFLELPCVVAGTFPYHDGAGIAPSATLAVPVQLPSAGTHGVPFRVRWALTRVPSGFVFDVQVKVPGSAAFVDWTSGTSPRGDYTGATAGSYSFQSRVRKTASGVATPFSPPVSIVLQ